MYVYTGDATETQSDRSQQHPLWKARGQQPNAIPDIACISYSDDRQRLSALTPEFVPETYGTPREGPFYKTDRPRAFFKMPCCRVFKKHEDVIHYAEIEACYIKSNEIDNYLGSREFRLQSFGEESADRYE